MDFMAFSAAPGHDSRTRTELAPLVEGFSLVDLPGGGIWLAPEHRDALAAGHAISLSPPPRHTSGRAMSVTELTQQLATSAETTEIATPHAAVLLDGRGLTVVS